ncbi:methyltransferase Rrg1 [Schizosaccharomyces japonicus yFS275]|uniref:Methyltransferase Rrg1 n=1 Tax=Schizosaccharomyces japonicus (strain yFS275 / FY16936) TaxID=402676 RepID=B6JXF1_SCHJY|nr:methyltransferase Rrg1 [Schizosaccharomyces japonicus yFS275]EEB06052.1 methyltransferase Rrg1 [Schizosaccharomyces japonicus yFS275]
MELPSVQTRPSYNEIKAALAKIPTGEHVWELSHHEEKRVLDWMIRLMAANLEWLDDMDEREDVMMEMSARIAERSGRMSAPTKTRNFTLPTEETIVIREPRLTYESLGFKTWGSAPLLTRNLYRWGPADPSISVLELGAGTGLMGIGAATMLGWQVVCTDLPVIVDNLRYNVEQNAKHIAKRGGSVSAQVLDWTNPPPTDGEDAPAWAVRKYNRVMVSDCLYETQFAELCIALILRFLRPDGVLLTEYPLRETTLEEIATFEGKLFALGFERVTGEEIGEEDFGSHYPVTCRWSRWFWSNERNETSEQRVNTQ